MKDKMISLRTSLSIIALLAGVGIFLMSLFSAVEASSGPNPSMSERRFYVHGEMQADHVLYPVVSALKEKIN